MKTTRLEQLKKERGIIQKLRYMGFDMKDTIICRYNREIDAIEQYGSDNPEIDAEEMAEVSL